MGLSIHYQGRILDYSILDELTNEAEDICKSLNWNYHVWKKGSVENDHVHINDPAFLNYTFADLKGITILPSACEPIDLVFFPSGLLCSPVKLKYNDPLRNDLMVETVSAKTQFAGMDTHLTVLKLLQYFSDKYFSVFELSDEGMYWKTKDEEVLKLQFTKYNFILKSVRDALCDFKALPGETSTSLADRLEELLKSKLGKREE